MAKAAAASMRWRVANQHHRGARIMKRQNGSMRHIKHGVTKWRMVSAARTRWRINNGVA
jgi:hypothetical protein